VIELRRYSATNITHKTLAKSRLNKHLANPQVLVAWVT